jgi:hypothetical protein
VGDAPHLPVSVSDQESAPSESPPSVPSESALSVPSESPLSAPTSDDAYSYQVHGRMVSSVGVVWGGRAGEYQEKPNCVDRRTGT